MTEKFLIALIAARRDRVPVGQFGEAEKPLDLAEGYRLQARLNQHLGDLGGAPLGGHKIGCTTPVMQDYLGIPHPCYGEVLASRTYTTPATLRYRDFIRPGVECEIAVTLAADMTPGARDYDQHSALDHVGSYHAAIEIVDDRYEDFESLGVAALVADNFFNAAEVLGPSVAKTLAFDPAASKGEMRLNGRSVGQGEGAMILGHPLTALAWLANIMNQRGTPLRAGNFVSLGSVVKTVWIDNPGTKVEVFFDGLGSAVVDFV